MFLRLVHCLNTSPVDVIVKPSSIPSFHSIVTLSSPIANTVLEILTSSRFSHAEKTPVPIVCVPSGIFIVFKLLHPLKAYGAINLILSGKLILFTPGLSKKQYVPILLTPYSITTFSI